ncbi:MAG: Minf_1886 family protein [Planctomycetota bacterium]
MVEDLEERILELRLKDGRYAKNAYYFLLESLDYTLARLADSCDRHVEGSELLAGIRELAKERFGALAKEVFNQWGIRSTEDFGQVVFNLVSAGLLQRRPQDSMADFEDGYDFEREFERGYETRIPWEELSGF